MGLNSFKRYEKKFLVTKEQYESLMPELLKYMRYDRYCLDGKVYHIHNVYYDTVDNEIIRNSTNTLRKSSVFEAIMKMYHQMIWFIWRLNVNRWD